MKPGFAPINNYLVRKFRPKDVIFGPESLKDCDSFTLVICPENQTDLEPGRVVLGLTEHLRPVDLDGCGFFLLPPQDILAVIT